MGRSLKILAAAVVGFIVPTTLIVGAWAIAFDSGDCSGDECALEYAAMVTWALATGALVSAVASFVAYVLTRRSHDSIP